MDRKTKGNKGEVLIKDFYEEQGYEILEKNYRHCRAEIDLIALKDDLLIFIEVKLRSSDKFGPAETFVSRAQENRIKDAAEEYIYAINWMKDIRFDIASVDSEGNIELFEDAF